MTDKIRILDALGEPGLLLPAQVGAALAAKDRADYYFKLLQAARARADDPASPAPTLVAARIAAGIDDDGFDNLPSGATRSEDGRYVIAGLSRVVQRLRGELTAMLEPLRVVNNPQAMRFAERIEALESHPWCGEDDEIDAAQIVLLTSADRECGDSVHRVTLDLHTALTALHGEIATDEVDGAAVYDILPGDRATIAAFMRGIDSTRALKFDHPGLGTTATRNGERLVLQNDIGTSDAHVLIVHVVGLTVSVTYTDVHIQRLLHFQSLFEHWAVHWDDTLSRTDRMMDGGVYHLCVGRFAANNEAGVTDFLAFLGSRLVFLIDWNRARKRLRQLLPKKEAIALLKWAADENLGHLAWLQAGGEHLVFEALSLAAGNAPAFGARLHDVLDLRKAENFMRFVVLACCRGMLHQRPHEGIRDEIRAELAGYFRSTQQQLLDLAAAHAALAIDIARGLRDCLLDTCSTDAPARIDANAARARALEHRADELVSQARTLNHQAERANFYRNLIEVADDVADELEEAAFHLTLLPHAAPDGELRALLQAMAALAAGGAEDYLKALDTARSVRRGGPSELVQAFLESIRRIVAAERQSDDAQRAVKLALVREPLDGRAFYAFAECARNLEAACDAQMHAALQLRDYVLASLAGD